MQFKGTKVLANKFERASTKGVDSLLKIIDDEAEMIEKRARRDVPVGKKDPKKGEERLKNTFFKDSIGGGLNRGWRIGFTAKHAAYKEFGTGMGLRVDGEYAEFSNYAMNFKTTNFPENYTKQKKYLLSAFILSRRSANKKNITAVKNLIK
jgi:hypothetical protein